MNEIKDRLPEDRWIEVPDEELAKKGETQWVYKPSNYPGPIAIDDPKKKMEMATK